jgi:hypothetical protein
MRESVAKVLTTAELIKALREIDPSGENEILAFAGSEHGLYVDMPDGMKRIIFLATD